MEASRSYNVTVESNGTSHVNHALDVQNDDIQKNRRTFAEPSANESCVDQCCKCGCMEQCSNCITNALENFYFRVGKLIGNYPGWVVLVMVVIGGLCGFGMFKYNSETDPEKLWSPQNSLAQQDANWVKENFPSLNQFNSMIFSDDNVLSPNVIKGMANVYEKVIDITIDTDDGSKNWRNLCSRLGRYCWVTGILELWNFNLTKIRGLTQVDILHDVNNNIVSPRFNTSFDATKFLGKIARSANGSIIGAEAAKMTFAIRSNQTTAFNEREKPVEEWESEFIKIGESGDPNVKKVYYFAVRSFGDLAGDSISSDVVMLSAGYFLILVYVFIVLGRFNCVQHKVYVSLVGVVCIGLSILVSFGLSSSFGLDYTPVHSILPFLLLGIGVDDMFVIIQAWNNLDAEQRTKSVPERTAIMMRHAGVAITITSITDFFAFAIGATTVLPALRSFCIFTAVGIIALLLFQGSVFVALHSLDERRAEAKRNACLCCYKHKPSYIPNKCSQIDILATIGEKAYVPLLKQTVFKVIVIVLTFGLLGWGIYGLTKLEQDYDPFWFLPTDSYGTDYRKADLLYFPSDSVSGYVYTGAKFDYYNDWKTLTRVFDALRQDDYVFRPSVDSWFEDYRVWLNSSAPGLSPLLDPATKFPSNSSNFFLSVGLWKSSQTAQRYSGDVLFQDTTTYQIAASRISYQHTPVSTSTEEIQAMDSVEELVAGFGYPADVLLSSSFYYTTWETNKIIRTELFRNLGLAGLCIFLVTLVLLANFWLCLMVFCCVIFTLIDVTALMYFWDLTIDTVTSINLILAIGLAVDYCAHIAHMFMTIRGSRNERAATTVVRMGSAVFHGGFSTFLAFILLILSNSYVFTVFFKVFFAVVLFGLFHGLIFLPCVLALIGPPPYAHAQSIDLSQEETQLESKKSAPHGVENKRQSRRRARGKRRRHSGRRPSVELSGQVHSSQAHARNMSQSSRGAQYVVNGTPRDYS